ncbi:MAG: hypothetical protein ACE14L_06365 [Terriglobales bacterium]
MPANAIGTAKEMLEPLSEKMQEGVEVSRRALRNVRDKAETVLSDATHGVKRHPWESVGVALAIGVALGAAAGFFIGKALTRRRRKFFYF